MTYYILATNASFPVGVAKRAGNLLTFNQPFNFDAAGRWDFEGLEVWFEADATLTKPKSHNSLNSHLFQIGNAGKNPDVVINSGMFDPSDLIAATGEGAVQLASGSLKTSNTVWGDAARDFMSQSGGSWEAHGDKFGMAGVGYQKDGHCDGVGHIYGGDVLLDGCLIDARLHGRVAPICGWTALIYGQPTRAPVSIAIRNTPILGAVDLGLLYSIQTNPRKYNVDVDIRACQIELGIHGHFLGDTPVSGGGITTFTGANNVNATTLQPWTLTR